MASTPPPAAPAKAHRDVGQLLQQRVPAVRFGEHHRLGAGVVAARAALDEIRRQRERRAREPDQRDVTERGHQQRHRVGYRLNPLPVKRFHRVDVGGSAHGRRDHRPDARDDVQVDAGAQQRHHDVGEQDRRVDVVPAHRLQGDLADQLGVEAGRQHVCLGPQRPVFGQRTARLPHEPHRDPAGLPTGDGGQIRRLGEVAASTHCPQCCHDGPAA